MLSMLLFSCGNGSSSFESLTSSFNESLNDEIVIYDFENNLVQNEIDNYEFTYSFKEYQGSLTPTDSSLLTFTLSEDGTYYIVSDREYKLNVNDLVIPSSYNSLPVKEIGAEAFAYKSWLNSVVIPSSIERIGAGAFNGTGLKTVYYDAEEVEDFNGRNWVFYDSENNQNIDIYFGKNVKKIPSRLFYPLATEPNKTCKVNNIYFSSECKLESIGDYAFYKLSNVKSITLPSTIKNIGNYAFYESGITKIDLRNVEEIGEYAFSFSNLKNVKFGMVDSIGEGAFSYCYNLENADLSNTNISVISDFLFKKCYGLKNVLFNDGVLSIGEESFSYCSSLTQFIAPESLKTIGLKAFYENILLKDIKLNSSLECIGNYAFYNVENLTRLYVSCDLGDFNLGNFIFVNAGKKSSLQVAFLEGVKKIPSNFMFANSNVNDNPLIDELILPRTLEEIGSSAFFDLKFSSIWYLGSQNEFANIAMNEQNNLTNVKYAVVMR